MNRSRYVILWVPGRLAPPVGKWQLLQETSIRLFVSPSKISGQEIENKRFHTEGCKSINTCTVALFCTLPCPCMSSRRETASKNLHCQVYWRSRANDKYKAKKTVRHAGWHWQGTTIGWIFVNFQAKGCWNHLRWTFFVHYPVQNPAFSPHVSSQIDAPSWSGTYMSL